jgi:hypothetical protein
LALPSTTSSPDGCTTPEKKNFKKRYSNKFNPQWSETFPCITASTKSMGYAFCKPCRLDFKIEHGGIIDVKDHTETNKHKLNANATRLSAVDMMKRFKVRVFIPYPPLLFTPISLFVASRPCLRSSNSC